MAENKLLRLEDLKLHFRTTQGIVQAVDGRMEKIREAKLRGYEGDACGDCGNFTLVRNGTCLKCTTCGSTSGCS